MNVRTIVRRERGKLELNNSFIAETTNMEKNKTTAQGFRAYLR